MVAAARFACDAHVRPVTVPAIRSPVAMGLSGRKGRTDGPAGRRAEAGTDGRADGGTRGGRATARNEERRSGAHHLTGRSLSSVTRRTQTSRCSFNLFTCTAGLLRKAYEAHQRPSTKGGASSASAFFATTRQMAGALRSKECGAPSPPGALRSKECGTPSPQKSLHANSMTWRTSSPPRAVAGRHLSLAHTRPPRRSLF